LWLYLQREKQILVKPVRLLHVAPERAIRAHLEHIPDLTYLTVDRFAEAVAVRCDVQTLPFQDFSVDAVICYHVLEHVADDRQAMRELVRVLRPNAWALFEVPLRLSASFTDEDPDITDPGERFRRFGQEDHIRWYGMDFFTRLSEAGFKVEVRRYDELLPATLITRHALWNNGLVAVCSR
jgi:SAM-dependent methyltransferase